MRDLVGIRLGSLFGGIRSVVLFLMPLKFIVAFKKIWEFVAVFSFGASFARIFFL